MEKVDDILNDLRFGDKTETVGKAKASLKKLLLKMVGPEENPYEHNWNSGYNTHREKMIDAINKEW